MLWGQDQTEPTREATAPGFSLTLYPLPMSAPQPAHRLQSCDIWWPGRHSVTLQLRQCRDCAFSRLMLGTHIRLCCDPPLPPSAFLPAFLVSSAGTLPILMSTGLCTPQRPHAGFQPGPGFYHVGFAEMHLASRQSGLCSCLKVKGQKGRLT